MLTPEQQRTLEEICLQSGSDCQLSADVPQDRLDITMGDVANSSEADEAHKFAAQYGRLSSIVSFLCVIKIKTELA